MTSDSDSRKFSYGLTAAVFLPLAALVLLWYFQNRYPLPVFSELAQNQETVPGTQAFARGEKLTIRFDLPGDDLKSVLFPSLLREDVHRMKVRVRNETQNDELLAEHVIQRDEAVPVRGITKKGDHLRLECEWVQETPPVLAFSSEGVPSFRLYKDWDEVESRTPASVPVSLKPKAPVVHEFIATEADIMILSLPQLSVNEYSRVGVELRNLTRDVVLKKSTARDLSSYIKGFTPNNAVGDRMRLTVVWQLQKRPKFHFPIRGQVIDVEAKLEDTELEAPPIFLLQYHWGERWALALWLLVPVTLALSLWRKLRPEVVVALLGVAGMVSGFLIAQQTYSLQTFQLDPDQYREYAEKMGSTLSGETSLEELSHYASYYPHAHLPLTPLAILAAALPFGGNTEVAYPLLSALCIFGTLLLVFHTAHRRLGLSLNQSLITVVLLGSHYILLKAFGRPSPDALGLLLVVATFDVILRRLTNGSVRGNLCLILLLTLTTLARPPGVVFVIFFVGAALVCDQIRFGKFRLGEFLKTGFVLALPVLLIWLGLFYALDWSENMAKAFKKAEIYKGLSTWSRFLTCLVPFVNALPLFIIPAVIARRVPSRHAHWILGAWAVFYLGLLVLVQAPFLHRIFLPILPVFVLLVGVAISKLDQRVAYVLTTLFLLLNVALVVYRVMLDTVPPSWIAHYIY